MTALQKIHEEHRSIAAVLHALKLPLLDMVALVVGTASVFFECAWSAYLPSLVEPDDLAGANGKLSTSRSVAYAAGPSAGGWLIGAFGGPLAMLLDAVSYVTSASLVATIRRREPGFPDEPATGARTGRLRREIATGLRVVRHDRLLRTLTIYSAITSLCVMMVGAVEIVFLVRTVRVPAAAIGVLLGLTSLGALAGALLAARAGRRLGDVRAMAGCALLAGAGLLLMPLAGPGARLTFFVAGGALSMAAIVGYNVLGATLSQRRTPDRLRARVSATGRVLAWSTPPLGALLGGAVATAGGPRVAMLLGGGLFLATALWLALALRGGVDTSPLIDPGVTDTTAPGAAPTVAPAPTATSSS